MRERGRKKFGNRIIKKVLSKRKLRETSKITFRYPRKSQKRTQETEDGHVLLKYQMTQQEKKKNLERLFITQVGGTLGNQNEEV